MKKRIILILVLVFFLIISSNNVRGTSVGSIDLLKISVSPSSYAKLNMIYHFDITFDEDNINKIKLKVPNSNFIVKSKCDLIKSITNEDKYAVITLNRKYMSGDKISLTFNLLQSKIYTLVKSKNMCKFKFKIGNIENFDINRIKLQWAKTKVKFCQSGLEQDNYYVVERDYSIIRNFNVLVEYEMNTFKYTEGDEKEFTIYDLLDNYFLVSLGLFIIIMEFIIFKKKGSRY